MVRRVLKNVFFFQLMILKSRYTITKIIRELFRTPMTFTAASYTLSRWRTEMLRILASVSRDGSNCFACVVLSQLLVEVIALLVCGFKFLFHYKIFFFFKASQSIPRTQQCHNKRAFLRMGYLRSFLPSQEEKADRGLGETRGSVGGRLKTNPEPWQPFK